MLVEGVDVMSPLFKKELWLPSSPFLNLGSSQRGLAFSQTKV
jgi:hypothetical protein